MSIGPSEQRFPTRNGSACSTEIQNASEVWPDRLRPLRSTAVKDSQRGRPGPRPRGDDGGLRVQRVEDGLDQEQVDAAATRGRDLLLVGLAHLIEGDGMVRGVVDPRRERERDVQRAHGARDEARPIRGLRRPLVRRSAREAGTLEAHLRRGVPSA